MPGKHRRPKRATTTRRAVTLGALTTSGVALTSSSQVVGSERPAGGYEVATAPYVPDEDEVEVEVSVVVVGEPGGFVATEPSQIPELSASDAGAGASSDGGSASAASAGSVEFEEGAGGSSARQVDEPAVEDPPPGGSDAPPASEISVQEIPVWSGGAELESALEERFGVGATSRFVGGVTTIGDGSLGGMPREWRVAG